VLDDREVEAVVICTPPHLHLEMMRQALEAGKHMLIEKPMVTRREDLDRILELADIYEGKRILLEASCRHARLQPKFPFIKNIIDSGLLGKGYNIHHQHLIRSTFIEYNPQAAWALNKAKAGGGPVLEWGIYDLSFHLGLLDDVPELKQLQGFTRNGLKVFKDPSFHSDVEELAIAFMEFNTGLTYAYERGSGVHMDILFRVLRD
jgi:predicted dehydrogenase